jgi:hypothetical protein
MRTFHICLILSTPYRDSMILSTKKSVPYNYVQIYVPVYSCLLRWNTE